MQISLLTKVLGDAPFTILFATDRHVEMIHGTEDVAYFLTVTPLEGATIHSGMTIAALESLSQSVYLTARDRGLPSGQDRVAEGELLGPEGLIPEPLEDNVVHVNFRKRA